SYHEEIHPLVATIAAGHPCLRPIDTYPSPLREPVRSHRHRRHPPPLYLGPGSGREEPRTLAGPVGLRDPRRPRRRQPRKSQLGKSLERWKGHGRPKRPRRLHRWAIKIRPALSLAGPRLGCQRKTRTLERNRLLSHGATR